MECACDPYVLNRGQRCSFLFLGGLYHTITVLIFITLTTLIIKVNSTIQIIVLWTRPRYPSHQLRFNYIY